MAVEMRTMNSSHSEAGSPLSVVKVIFLRYGATKIVFRSMVVITDMAFCSCSILAKDEQRVSLEDHLSILSF